MSSVRGITDSLNEAWEKLNARWTGDACDAFYRQYMAKMTETSGDFEEACTNLSIGAADLSKKLELIERDII